MTTTYAGMTAPSRFEADLNTSTSGSGTSFTTGATTLSGWKSHCAVYLIISLNSGTTTVNSITSTYGGTWSRVTQTTQGSMRQEIWVNTTTTTNTGTITVTTSAATLFAMAYRVYSTPSGTLPTVTVSQVKASSTSFSVAGPTLTEANTMVDVLAHILSISTATLSISGTSPINLRLTSGGPDRNTAATPSTSPGTPFGMVKAYTEDPPGIGTAAVSITGTLSTSKTYIAAVFLVHGDQVALDDYTYQYGDGTTLLNNQAGTPIFDIEKITGLSDINIDSESSDYDGAHGGYTYAKYLSQKTIAFEGTMYATPFDESVAETFRSNYVPAEEDKPLYFKHPGVGRRVLWCKPIGFKADIDQGRARGVMPFQLQLQASDPRMYSDQKYVDITPLSSTVVTSAGTMSTLPVIYFFVSSADVAAGSSFLFTRVASANRAVGVDIPAGTTVGLYKLDFASRTLTDPSGVDVTDLLTVRSWWTIDPGSNTLNFLRPAGSEAVTVAYSEAYI